MLSSMYNGVKVAVCWRCVAKSRAWQCDVCVSRRYLDPDRLATTLGRAARRSASASAASKRPRQKYDVEACDQTSGRTRPRSPLLFSFIHFIHFIPPTSHTLHTLHCSPYLSLRPSQHIIDLQPQSWPLHVSCHDDFGRLIEQKLT